MGWTVPTVSRRAAVITRRRSPYLYRCAVPDLCRSTCDAALAQKSPPFFSHTHTPYRFRNVLSISQMRPPCRWPSQRLNPYPIYPLHPRRPPAPPPPPGVRCAPRGHAQFLFACPDCFIRAGGHSCDAVRRLGRRYRRARCVCFASVAFHCCCYYSSRPCVGKV